MIRGNNLIIAISGKMQRGKDTIGNYLIAKYKFKRIGFADKLKEVCMNYDNSMPGLRSFWNKKVAREVLGNEKCAGEVDILAQRVCPGIWRKLTHEECFGVKTDYARLTLQEFAQGMRQLKADCWVECVIRKCREEGGRWVITDVRYLNEAFAIEVSEDAQIWRVTRPIEDKVGSQHISECNLDNYPFEVNINNDSTIEMLQRRVDKVIKPLLRGTRPFANGEEVY